MGWALLRHYGARAAPAPINRRRAGIVVRAPMPDWIAWGAGIGVLSGLTVLTFWPRAGRHRTLVLVGSAMIYVGYVMAFGARMGFVKKLGLTTEAQLIYEQGSRYSVLPLVGMAAVIATLLAACRPIRRIDARPVLASLVGASVALIMLAVQSRKALDHWSHLTHQPDQQRTLAALHTTRRVARNQGISRAQLMRITTPVMRVWDVGVLPDCPLAFPLMMLVEVPDKVDHPRSDDEARAILSTRLNRFHRAALGYGACASFNPKAPGPEARTLAVGKVVEMARFHQNASGRYTSERAVPGSIKFAFDRTLGARFLDLTGFSCDKEVMITWQDPQGRWLPGNAFRWLTATRPPGPAVVDLERIIQVWAKPITELSIQLLEPGEVALSAPPRLLR